MDVLRLAITEPSSPSPPSAYDAGHCTSTAPERSDLVELVARQQVVSVDDAVRVPLLGEEALPVRREVLVDRVAGDHRVEARLMAVRLRTQHPPQPLRLLLP